jgi:hypothetical protein
VQKLEKELAEALKGPRLYRSTIDLEEFSIEFDLVHRLALINGIRRMIRKSQREGTENPMLQLRLKVEMDRFPIVFADLQKRVADICGIRSAVPPPATEAVEAEERSVV